MPLPEQTRNKPQGSGDWSPASRTQLVSFTDDPPGLFTDILQGPFGILAGLARKKAQDFKLGCFSIAHTGESEPMTRQPVVVNRQG